MTRWQTDDGPLDDNALAALLVAGAEVFVADGDRRLRLKAETVDSGRAPAAESTSVRLFRRPLFPADLIPLASRPEWERYSLFEARGEEAHPLADDQLAERCGVDHDAPYFGVRFAREEMCDAQWSCTAAYYEWLDRELERSPSTLVVGPPLRPNRVAAQAGGPGSERSC